MTQTYTHTSTYTYTRSELIVDLVSGAFDRVLEQLGVSRTVPVDGFEEALKRGWLSTLSVVASSKRSDGSSDWHVALTAEIDAATHVARLAVDAEREIALPRERADDIADRLSYYSQMFVKVAKRHAQPNWRYGLWWRPSRLGGENHDEFNELTGSSRAVSHRAAAQKLGQYSPEEIDETTFGLEVFGDAE